MNNILKLLAVFFIAFQSQAQELLTIEEAVRIALENNYEIRIASNNLEIDKTGVNIGNAGMLPALAATANSNNSIQNSSLTRADGTTIELDDALNNSFNYGVVMDWTIFDGFRMFARYNQLKELENLSDAQLQQTILAKVSDVMITYYDLVQQQQRVVRSASVKPASVRSPRDAARSAAGAGAGAGAARVSGVAGVSGCGAVGLVTMSSGMVDVSCCEMALRTRRNSPPAAGR
ncbi:MAG: TolC family protein [Gillisia sp.]